MTILRVAAGLGVSAVFAQAQTYSANAAFNPAQLPAGQIGSYQVTVTVNTQTARTLTPDCTPPKVEGLEMSSNPSIGNNQSFRFENGVVSSSLSFTLVFQVRAEKNGHYTVPAFDMTLSGSKISIPAASLEVTDKPTEPSNSDLVSLETKIRRTDLYVGEMLPFDVTLYWRANLRPDITGDLDQGGDAFERVQLKGRNDQSSVSKNGQSYFANTWHSNLVPLIAGPQKFSLSLPLQVTIPDPRGVSDPFIAQFMGPNSPFVSGQQRAITAESVPVELNVQPLPEAGRPEHFTGGIGTFSADEPTLSSTSLQVGVPVTFTLKVSGEGNFNRLNTPELDLGSLWRTYPAKDSFKPLDTDGYHGIKTFEYVIMPLSDNITLLPAPQVNFFNPDTKIYIELPLKPIAVKVQSAAPGQSVPLPAITSTTPVTSNKSELVSLHIDAGEWQSSQPALILQTPLFWAGQVVPAVLFAGLVITRRRQLRIENDPAFARRLRARKQAVAAVAQARAAAAKGQAAEFYSIAQRALQEAASHDRLDAAEALTWREFDAHLAKRGDDVDVRQQSREIFESGDALRFGGFTPDKDALAEAAARLDGLVQKLLGSA